jgi:hypothetical protein
MERCSFPGSSYMEVLESTIGWRTLGKEFAYFEPCVCNCWQSPCKRPGQVHTYAPLIAHLALWL